MSLILNIIDKFGSQMKSISERKDFHPEPNLFCHFIAVIMHASVHKDKDLQLAAIFHDLGKVYTYAENQNAHGHERTSAWIVSEYAEEIEAEGGNFEKIHWLVLNHRKGADILDNLPVGKSYELTTHKWWSDMVKLCGCDDMQFLNKKNNHGKI